MDSIRRSRGAAISPQESRFCFSLFYFFFLTTHYTHVLYFSACRIMWIGLIGFNSLSLTLSLSHGLRGFSLLFRGGSFVFCFSRLRIRFMASLREFGYVSLRCPGVAGQRSCLSSSTWLHSSSREPGFAGVFFFSRPAFSASWSRTDRRKYDTRRFDS